MDEKVNEVKPKHSVNHNDVTLSEGSDDSKEDHKLDAGYNTFERPISAVHEGDEKSEHNKSDRTSYSITKPDSEFTHALFNFTKSFVGIGALTIAGAMEHAGVFLGLLGIIG